MAEYKWSASVDYFGRLSTQHLHRETQRPDDADPVSEPLDSLKVLSRCA